MSSLPPFSKFGQIPNKGEAAFARDMERAGKTWIYQPKVFRLQPPLRSYRPDFYVIEDRCFYEVCGTRQAYSYAIDKIEAFRREYPKLRLKIMNRGAWKDGARAPRLPGGSRRRPWLKPQMTLRGLSASAPGSLPAKLAEVMRAHGIDKLSDFARRFDWPYTRVHSVAQNEYRRPSTVERIAADLDRLLVVVPEAVNA